VHNVIVGCNIQALQAGAEKARELGFTPLILSDSITGNTREAALMHVALARQVLQTGDPLPPPCCLISGGETTVRLTGDGKGGRNQEFALWCAREIAEWSHSNLLFSSLGSDGTDGPTDAAGAVASPETARLAASKGLSIQDYLDRNDSYHFFQQVGGLINTGPTLTNVMDLRFVLIDQ
jgi:hydroxypyruvate reductase